MKRKLEIEVDCEDSTCGGCEVGVPTNGYCPAFGQYRERSDGTRSTSYPAVLGPYPRLRLQACLASEVPARTCGTCKHYRSDGVCKLDGCDRVHDEGCPKWEACHLGVVKVGTPLFRDGDSVSTTPSSPTDRPVGFEKWLHEFTTRIFVPTGYPKSLDDVRDHLTETPIQVDHEGRLTPQEEARINAAFAPFGLVCGKDEDGGRQFVEEGKIMMWHKDEAKPWDR